MTPGRLHLVDTSAHARGTHPAVQEVLVTLVAEGVAATCVTVDLEAGFSGRNGADVAAIIARRQELYVALAINEAIAQRARQVQLMLATHSHHRSVGVVDLLTAAVAEFYGATVLHYDKDFERVAAVTGQSTRWVVPRGSID